MEQPEYQLLMEQPNGWGDDRKRHHHHHGEIEAETVKDSLRACQTRGSLPRVTHRSKCKPNTHAADVAWPL